MSVPATDEVELLRRGVAGFGEALALLGRHGPDATEVRTDGVLGALAPGARDNHWIDAVVSRPGTGRAAPPHCLWSTAETTGDGRRASEVTMPVMALDLTADAPVDMGSHDVVDLGSGFDELGVLNDLAYDQDALAPMLASLPAGAGHGHGVRDDDGTLVSAALAVDVDDDTSVQWVATHPDHRRRGHAGRVLVALLDAARRRGRTTATLQSSPDGFAVYERLGFRTVGTLRAHLA